MIKTRFPEQRPAEPARNEWNAALDAVDALTESATSPGQLQSSPRRNLRSRRNASGNAAGQPDVERRALSGPRSRNSASHAIYAHRSLPDAPRSHRGLPANVQFHVDETGSFNPRISHGNSASGPHAAARTYLRDVAARPASPSVPDASATAQPRADAFRHDDRPAIHDGSGRVVHRRAEAASSNAIRSGIFTANAATIADGHDATAPAGRQRQKRAAGAAARPRRTTFAAKDPAVRRGVQNGVKDQQRQTV